MLLAPDEAELFFKLHRSLMFFVNERLGVVPALLLVIESGISRLYEPCSWVLALVGNGGRLFRRHRKRHRLNCRKFLALFKELA